MCQGNRDHPSKYYLTTKHTEVLKNGPEGPEVPVIKNEMCFVES